VLYTHLLWVAASVAVLVAVKMLVLYVWRGFTACAVRNGCSLRAC
jgi:hypothetical protein